MRHKGTWIALVAIGTGCDPSGSNSFRQTPAPELTASPTVRVEPHVVLDADAGIPWAREGAVVSVGLEVDAPEGFDDEASTVTFTGVPLDQTDDDVWSRTLDGQEGTGLKTLDVVLVDDIGQQTRLSFDADADTPIQVGFDFDPPTADCVLSPPVSNGDQAVTATVFANEALAGRPQLALSAAGIVATPVGDDTPRREYAWTLNFPDQATLQGYGFLATATDRVGNPQTGDSLCTVAPSADRFGKGPTVSDITLSVSGDAVYTDPGGGGPDRVGPGARLEVAFTSTDIDTVGSTVRMGDIALAWDPTDQVWFDEIGDGDGDGPKSLEMTLFDDAGNRTEVQRTDLAVVVDRTPPVAGCQLFPAVANGQDTISLQVFASEPLDPSSLSVTGVAPLTPVGPTVTDNTYAWTLQQPEPPADLTSYTASITATDRVGNPQAGASLCLEAHRQGTVRGVGPAPAGSPSLTVVSGFSVDENGVPRVGPGAVLAVTLPVTGAVEPEDSTVQLGDVPLGWDAGSGTWRVTIDTSMSDGVKRLQGTLFDDAGNPLDIDDESVAARLDLTPPEVVGAAIERSPFSATATDGDTTYVTAEDVLTGESVSVEIAVVVTEPLGVPATLDEVGPYDLGFEGDGSTSRQLRWSLDALEDTAPGEWAYTVVLTDRFGNVSEAQPLGVTLVYDRDRPGAPDVHTRDRIVLHRAPWGRVGSSAPSFGVAGRAGAVEPGALVVARTAQGNILGTVVAEEDGSFSRLPVPLDLADVYVSQLDRAGNPSVDVLVRDGLWYATPNDGGGPNPHEVWADAFSEGGLEGGSLVSPSADLASPSQAVTTEGHGRWTIIGSDRHGTPAARVLPGMVLDPVRNEVILLGGSDAGGFLGADRTWAWDGLSWRDATPSSGDVPSSMGTFVGVFDPIREQVIMYGGVAGSDLQSWAWDGTAWTRLTAGDSMPARTGHGAAFDPIAGRVILFGGLDTDGTTFLDDSWACGADGCGRLDVDATPPPRAFPAMVTDPVRRQVVLHGGHNATQALTDTWIFSNGTWTEVEPATMPPPRVQGSAAWDPTREMVVIHGGNDTTPLGDTWGWNGTDWVELATAPADPDFPAAGAGLAVDPRGRGLVRFGGTDGGTDPHADTWYLQGDTWTNRRPPGPMLDGGRVVGTFLALPPRDEVFVFGGAGYATPDGLDFGALQRPLVLRGAEWVALDEFGAPEGRRQHAAAFDEARDEVVVFGGIGETEIEEVVLDDTWTFDGTNWTQHTPASAPSHRRGAVMAYDAQREEVLLFGGRDVNGVPLSDMWAWDGSTWTEITPFTRPWPRESATWTEDPRTGELILFGGSSQQAGGQGGVFNDTWIWADDAWTQAQPPGERPQPRLLHGAGVDPARRQVVVMGGTGTNSFPLNDTWSWTGTQWVEVDPGAPLGGPVFDLHTLREGHGMAVDPVEERLLRYGGVVGAATGGEILQELAQWEHNKAERPRHRLSVDLSAANLPSDADILGTYALWTAGGIGYPAGSPTAGARLLAWTGWGWREVAQHDADDNTPTPLCLSVRDNASVPDLVTPLPGSPGCVDILDPAQLDLWMPDPQTGRLHFAVEPIAGNGFGNAADPTEAHARIASDVIEVGLRYRLPAHVRGCDAGDRDEDDVCDDVDLCLGDDATGDLDGDGFCLDTPPVQRWLFQSCPNGWEAYTPWECGASSTVTDTTLGSNVFATGLDEDYPPNLSFFGDAGGLRSAPFTVPEGISRLSVRMQWDLADGDGVFLVIEGGSPGGLFLEPDPPYNGSVGVPAYQGASENGWTNVNVDLTPYAGDTVNLAFKLISNGSEEGPGVVIDAAAVGRYVPK